MDPNETLHRILAAIEIGDVEEYVEACEDLADWMDKGGFAPTVPEGMTYIPGTGTCWVILSPLGFPGSDNRWALVRYNDAGMRVKTYHFAN
jgi:hypothetical protein